MTQNYTQLLRILVLTIIFMYSQNSFAQTVVGSGSYTENFPGVDQAGRNGFPSGTPQLSGNAMGKPVPTNDWWSKLVKEDHADNLFNYPMTLKTTNQGLIVTYIPFGVIGDSAPVEVGLTGLSASKTTVSDYSDWTVTMNWNDNTHELEATTGIGMPFIYFTKGAADNLEIKVNSGVVTISNEMLIVENASSGADFVFYAPSGSSWTQSGSTYASTLNDKNYWSMAMLPQENTDVNAMAESYKKYAYVFPSNTKTSWSFDAVNSKVLTTFTVETDVKEGTETNVLQGLLPHQWANLAPDSATPENEIYNGVRGEIKTLDGNVFSVENTFKGILPTMPYLANYSEGFSPSELEAKISQIENDGLSTWTDSYNEGQVMNRLIQTARIADQTGNVEARDKMIATIKERLEDWLTYQSGEVAFLFYYNSDWSAMLGYPAGHGQDSNINDHHFHWGYFIHAAAFMEQFEPGWANQWGDMVNLLVRDAASADRNDEQFPFLRNFSPYAGHCWANGFATFPQGNDQESTSESMQFNSSLIHWGTITGNDEVRDLGIYLYTTEQTAIEEYWFDIHERNFPASQQYSLVSRVWGNSFDNGTFWTADITASYGIELYPIHGGSLYLGHDTDYVQKLWNEIEANTEILSTSSTNPNLWHDTFWKYLSLLDAEKAIELYSSYPDRIMKFGVSDAQTYHWIHAMNALGTVKSSITANYPIASAFEKEGVTTYVAHNYSGSPISVSFSDGFVLEVPAYKLATSRDVSVSGTIVSNFEQAYPNGSVDLSAITAGSPISKVEFYDGTQLLGEDLEPPYEMQASNLSLGIHGMYAKIYDGSNFNVTNIVEVQVGDQVPYLGAPSQIPGTFEAGHFDKFEGGVGQGIAYVDVSQINEGGFRPDEYVDSATDADEGETIGWISAGEWVEYTVEVENPGNYSMSFRYASGNPNGGGPFYLEIDGEKISSDISLESTSTTNWSTWVSKTASNIELNKGTHVVRLVFENGEFNLGKMTFEYTSALSYNPPFANAGENVIVVLPETTATLDGSLSTDEDTAELNYAWEQLYGPSDVVFSDETAVAPEISNLEAGVYEFKLTVSDDTHSSKSVVKVIVSETGNSNPVVEITSPSENDAFKQNTTVTIEAIASDLEGSIALVEFFVDGIKIGEDATAPYSIGWLGEEIGIHEITAQATDNEGAVGTSKVVNIAIEEVKLCEETSTEAIEGAFSVGYKVKFETVGTNVSVIFELLDTDKTGVIAYLFDTSDGGFSESPMDWIADNTFSKTLGGQTNGTTLKLACKFAFAGGQAVTKYFDYVVGSDCSSGADSEAPTNFTASIGAVSASSIELILNATDNSGTVAYNVSYEGGTENLSVGSGVETRMAVTGLSSSTLYNFSIEATDLVGNIANNSPIELQASTTENTNTACSGMDSEAQQGAFDVGYNYHFETTGTDVKFTFELLDNKDGVIAYLWKESPFGEIAMSNTSGKEFIATVSNQTIGETIRYACKFAFAGGLAVTKYFSYVVGDNCSDEPSDDDGDGVVNTLDLCPGTPVGKSVDVNGCILFDANNFTIETVSETCPDRDNGSISISALEVNPYRVSLNGTVYEMNSSSIEIDNLAPGNYELCLVVPEESATYCYNLTIDEGTVISAKSSTSKSKATVEIQNGTAPFEVYLNGESVLKTQSTVFDVNVKHGDVLEVLTAVSCEGIYSKSIQMLDEFTAYPNPTNGVFEISLPKAMERVMIEVYNENSQLLVKKQFPVSYGKVQMDLSNQPSGIYLVKVGVDHPVTLKIIKN